jgi:hypothetical protein
MLDDTLVLFTTEFGRTPFTQSAADKVGLGRIYVKLGDKEELTYDNWVQGLKDGRSYCGDGLSHILDFRVNNVAVGEPGSNGKISQLNLEKPGTVKVAFDVAAYLASPEPTPETDAIRNRRLDQKPYWHLERARLGKTRDVPVEVIVDGKPAATKTITADGKVQSLSFDIPLHHSSWIAVRILPSVHTNPVFIEVGNKPIRASRKSAEWCVNAVDVCWKAKVGSIRATEQQAAKAAYDKARAVYAAAMKEAVEE